MVDKDKCMNIFLQIIKCRKNIYNKPKKKWHSYPNFPVDNIKKVHINRIHCTGTINNTLISLYIRRNIGNFGTHHQCEDVGQMIQLYHMGNFSQFPSCSGSCGIVVLWGGCCFAALLNALLCNEWIFF